MLFVSSVDLTFSIGVMSTATAISTTGLHLRRRVHPKWFAGLHTVVGLVSTTVHAGREYVNGFTGARATKLTPTQGPGRQQQELYSSSGATVLTLDDFVRTPIPASRFFIP